MNTHETIEEARRLWHEVNRRNLMVKVPGTKPGLPAIRTLISEGINVNVTLLFSQQVYAEVAEAYISGLEAFAKKGGDPHKVSSVASFFVSRIDTLVDDELDKKIAATADPAAKASCKSSRAKSRSPTPSSLIGSMEKYTRTSAGSVWRSKALRPSACLWASTGTKNKAYSDVLYVDELIGPNTVNTMPPATMDAYRDHGHPRPSLEEDVDGAQAVMDALPKAGISIDAVTSKLVEDGVRLVRRRRRPALRRGSEKAPHGAGAQAQFDDLQAAGRVAEGRPGCS